MAIEKFCIHCGRHRGDLFKPTMVWNSLPNSAYKCWNGGDEYGYHEFGDWISDGKNPIRDWLFQWNYPGKIIWPEK